MPIEFHLKIALKKEAQKRMNVLVTGATGHIGLLLTLRLLDAGHTVRTLAFDNAKGLALINERGLEHFHADITQYDQIEAAFSGIECVFHLAAQVSFRDRGLDEMRLVNVEGVGNVIKACQRHHVRRLIYFSSIEALSPYPADATVDETRPLVGDDYEFPYPRTKAMGQRLVLEAQAQGLETVVIYPTAVTGPNDYHFRASNSLLLQFARGRFEGVTEGGFNFVDVRDVVELSVRAAEQAPSGSSYLASGHWHSILEAGTLIAALRGFPPPKISLTAAQLKLVTPMISWWNEMRGNPPTLTAAAVLYITNWLSISHERATREFGYQPRPFAETIRDTVRWFEESGALEVK